ncbi:MAG: AsmA family protein [Victivallales bacterium]|nr:AsmA family protein [Victivallales bacterium]
MKKIKKYLLISVLTIIALYFLITSSFVLKLILQPLLSHVFEFPVTAEKVSFHPLSSRLELENVKLGYQDNPFVEGEKGSWRINDLLGLICGKVDFSNIELENVAFRAVSSEDGKWNFPWMYNSDNEISGKPDGSDGLEERPVKLKLSDIKIRNGKILLKRKRKKPQVSSEMVFKNLNVESDLFANNKNTGIKYSGNLMINGRKVNLKNSNISGKISGYIDKWTVPASLISEFYLKNAKGNINNLNLKDNEVKLLTNIFTEGSRLYFRKLEFIERHGKNIKSNISLSGEINLKDNEGKLHVRTRPVSPEILNLFFNTLTNYNFGNMKIFYNGIIGINEKEIKNSGKIIINDFQIRKKTEETKAKVVPYDINLDYVLNYKYPQKLLTVSKLNSFFSKDITGQKRFNFQKIKKVMTIDLNDPVTFSLKKSKAYIIGNKSTGRIKLNNLDIRFLNSFLIDFPEIRLNSGISNGSFGFEVIPGTDCIDFSGKFDTKKLSFRIGDYCQKDIHIVHNFQCTLKNFKKLKLNPFSFRLFSEKRKILNTVLNGFIDFYNRKMDFTIYIPLLRDTIGRYLPKPVRRNQVFKKIISQLKPFQLSISLTVKLDKRTRTAEVGEIKVKIKSDKCSDTSLKLKKFIPLTWNEKQFIPKKDFTVFAEIKNLNTFIINDLLPAERPFSFTYGDFDTSFKCMMVKNLSELKMDGKLNALDFGIRNSSKKIDKLSFTSLYHLGYEPQNDNITVRDTNAILGVNRRNALSFEITGLFNTQNNTLDLNAEIFDLNKQFFSLIPKVTTEKIIKLNTAGKVLIKHKKGNSDVRADLKLNGLKYTSDKTGKTIVPFDSGTVKLDYAGNDKRSILKKGQFKLQKDKKTVLDINIKGGKEKTAGEEKTTLNIYSEKIYVNCLNNLLNAFTTPQKKTIKKPEKLKNVTRNRTISGFSLDGKLFLKNVYFSTFTAGQIFTDITLKKGILTLSPVAIRLNQSNIKGKAKFNLKYKNVYPYFIKLNCSSVPLKTLLNAFNIPNKGSEGDIKKISILLEGVDPPFSESKYKKLKGFFILQAENLALPLTLMEYKLFKIMFIPIQILSRLRQLVPNGLAPQSVTKTLISTSEIFSNLKKVHFKSATIKLDANNDIKISNFSLKGNSTDLIRFMEFKGLIELNKKICINTHTDVSGLHFPIEINGTLDEPETNYKKFLLFFMKDNAINILNPKNLVDFTLDVGKGLKNTVTGTVEFLATPLKK